MYFILQFMEKNPPITHKKVQNALLLQRESCTFIKAWPILLQHKEKQCLQSVEK